MKSFLSHTDKYIYKVTLINYELEYIRNNLMKKLIKIIYNRIGYNSTKFYRKIKTYISQMIMSIYTDRTFEKKNIYFEDAIFLIPTTKQLSGFYFDINYYLNQKKFVNDELRIKNLFEKAQQETFILSKNLNPVNYTYTKKDKYVVFNYKSKEFAIRNEIYHNLEKKYNGPDNKINDYILTGLIRYDTFGSGANQYMIDLNLKEFLKNKYNFDFECFGSMFNHYFTNYCSIFYDIERYFGSSGSIFTTDLLSGNFMANPPYDANLLNKMYEHIKKNMNKNNCIIYGIPKWDDFQLEEIMNNEKLYYKKMEKHLLFQIDSTRDNITIPPFIWYIFADKEYPNIDNLVNDLELFNNIEKIE